MRTMYDSATGMTIPAHATVVAGYIDGVYKWTTAEWDRFTHALKIEIAISASLNSGDVLDIETGDATPEQAEGWIKLRKAAGYYRPTIYCSRETVPAVRTGTGKYVLGTDYDLWVGDWTGVAHEVTAPGPGAELTVAVVQYASTSAYDISVLYDDDWPHRTPPAPPKPKVVDVTVAEAQAAIATLTKFVGQH